MAGNISTTIRGIPELTRKLTLLELSLFPRAMSKTLNSTATTVRAEQSRAIKDAMGVTKISAVKKRITIRRAKPNQLYVRLEYRGKPLNLIEFRARQLKKGVKHKAWGKQQMIVGAFITDIKGNRLVMIRQKKAGGRIGTGVTDASRRAAAARMQGMGGGSGRTPIKALWGPGIADTAARPDIAAVREKTVARVLTDRLRSNLDYELSKIAKRG